MRRFLVAMLVASCGATSTEPRLYRVVPVGVTPPAGITVNAAFDLPAGLDVDAYGARKIGGHLALGVGKRGGAPSAIAVIDVATAQLALLPSVNRGWTSTAIAGTGDWLIAREKRQRCADCWDWALYAYHLPSRVPLLLGRSAKPASQLFLPEPRGEGTFGWLQADGDALAVKRWRAGAPFAETVGTIPFEHASPYVSVDGDSVIVDERAEPPVLHRFPADTRAPARERYFPVVRGDHVAYARALPDHEVGDVAVDEQILPNTAGAVDLDWLDDHHVAIHGNEAIQIFDVRRPDRPSAVVAYELAAASHAAEGALVVVTDHTVISLSAKESP